MIKRRTLLSSLGAAAAASLLPRGARADIAPIEPILVKRRAERIHLARVKVARERIVKTVVGLRPFRPSGYVVKTEKLGDKIVVHNYGHGGAGVTLSWGTASLAVEQIKQTGKREIAVLGCGAVGLATARLLQQAGYKPTIYARELPPNTCSNIAGARWYPFDVFDRKVATTAFLDELWKISHVAYRIFTRLGPEYGVRRYMSYACRNSPFPAESLLHLQSPVHDLLPKMRDLSPDENPLPYSLVRTFETLFIEPHIYLPKVIEDYKQAGGTIVVRDLADAAALQALPEALLVNCTGLGASKLFGDTELMPIKGQLTILPPQADVDYITLPPDIYLFPRSDGIILGGTFQRGNWSLDVDRVAEERVLAKHQAFFASLKG